MTFDDDMIQFLVLSGGPKWVTLKSQGLEWPPPPKIGFFGFPYRRISMSDITDAERQKMTHVFRGAVYELDPDAAGCPPGNHQNSSL